MEAIAHTRSFNGAAIFRSRKPANTAPVSRSIVALQWGRDLSIAETVLRQLRPIGIAVLQWGRDLSIAETRETPKRARRVVELQWGRDLSIAETRELCSAHLRIVTLQWGRDLSIAETQRSGGRIYITVGASMGPRSFDRGNRRRTPHPDSQ